MVARWATIALLLLCSAVNGYRMFAERIPNGEQVPHPCKPNVLWHGVGHFNAEGGGFRNPFGQDFYDAGQQWTEALCRMDSDGDGRTNGEELGDPNCVWREGEIPSNTTGLSHPGICEPISSPRCSQKPFHVGLFHNQEEWMADACKSGEFDCPAVQENDVQRMSARVQPTQVPTKVTTYMCRIFQFEDIRQDYHLIATTPIINNSYIMHHIVLFACPDDVPERSEFECDMLPDLRCSTILSVWTLGLTGDCYHPNTGMRLGLNGIKKLAIQLHWNNPSAVDSYIDSSGLILHYTPTLRQYDSSVLLLGNEHFLIPPKVNRTVVKSKCSQICTAEKVTETIYITAGINHMHYLGRKQRVEQFRNGTHVRTITDDQIYSYDSPKFYSFSEPISVLPGDELITTCEYASNYKTTTTYYGESTAEEMCYSFLYFYPAQAISGPPVCTTYETVSSCDPDTYNGCYGPEEAKYYTSFAQLEVYHNITSACRPFGPCTSECLTAIMTARESEPCLTSGVAWERIQEWGLAPTQEGREFLAAMESCEIEIYQMFSSNILNTLH